MMATQAPASCMHSPSSIRALPWKPHLLPPTGTCVAPCRSGDGQYSVCQGEDQAKGAHGRAEWSMLDPTAHSPLLADPVHVDNVVRLPDGQFSGVRGEGHAFDHVALPAVLQRGSV